MVPDHLRPLRLTGNVTMPPLDTPAGTVQVMESSHGGICLVLDGRSMALASIPARRLAEQILFLVDGTVIVARDLGRP